MADTPPELPSELPPALSPDRPSHEAWSELERDFFAAAPPDVPQPPPEPMRFDDLEPLEAVEPAHPRSPFPWQAQLSRAWQATAAARRTLAATGREAYRRGAPVVVRAWRRGGPAVVRAWHRTIQLWATVRQRSAPVLAALRIGARNHWVVAAGTAALLVVMGVSAVVVASRGGGRSVTANNVPPVCGIACATVAEAAPQAAPEGDPTPVAMSAPDLAGPSDAIGPDPTPPARHKRKHAKPPARHAARVKPLKPLDLSRNPQRVPNLPR